MTETNKKKKHLFDDSIYKCVRRVEETVLKPAINNGRIVEVLMPTGKLIDQEVLIPELNNHKGKCKYRTAARFGVSIEHLEDAYVKLNGKKLDGFYITDLIDRTGFSHGIQTNTMALAEKYKHKEKYPVIVAENKLKDMLQNENVISAYAVYIKEIKDEINKKLKDDAVFGE